MRPRLVNGVCDHNRTCPERGCCKACRFNRLERLQVSVWAGLVVLLIILGCSLWVG